jgi:2'-5' RNA ligase
MPVTAAVISMLDAPLADQVRRLWAQLERDYSLTDVQAFPYPHLSFQGGRDADVVALKAALAEWVPTVRRFQIVIDGVDVFETPARTIYLRVVPSPDLAVINRQVNEIVAGHCSESFGLYRPTSGRRT